MLVVFNANAETLVLAVPQTEFPALAAQMLDGAKAALKDNWVIKPVDAGCTAEAAANIGNLILAERPDAVIGLPCIESLTLALNVLGPIGVPIVTIASRSEALSKLAMNNQWRLDRMGSREHEEGEAIAELLVAAWRELPFAILDDGTIFARDTAEAIRNEAETNSVKPVLVDGFQPQLENQKKLLDRIVSSGATHVFIAGDRANIAQIATEAAGLKLIFAGPETLRAADLDIPLPVGVLMAARDSPLDIAAEGYTTDALVAAEIAMALKADASLRSFNTSFGTLSAAPDGFMGPVNYALFTYDGSNFQKAER